MAEQESTLEVPPEESAAAPVETDGNATPAGTATEETQEQSTDEVKVWKKRYEENQSFNDKRMHEAKQAAEAQSTRIDELTAALANVNSQQTTVSDGPDQKSAQLATSFDADGWVEKINAGNPSEAMSSLIEHMKTQIGAGEQVDTNALREQVMAEARQAAHEEAQHAAFMGKLDAAINTMYGELDDAQGAYAQKQLQKYHEQGRIPTQDDLNNIALFAKHGDAAHIAAKMAQTVAQPGVGIPGSSGTAPNAAQSRMANVPKHTFQSIKSSWNVKGRD